MSTLHGKGAVFYMNPGTGAAVKITEAAEFSIDVDADFDPDPALGDTWETRLKGLMRFSGSINGNYDNAQTTLFAAATASTASSFYLYPASAAPTQYYYGQMWPKVSLGGGVTGRITDSISFEGEGALSTN